MVEGKGAKANQSVLVDSFIPRVLRPVCKMSN